MQQFIDLLSKVIFFTIVATIILAVVTYLAYRIREARKGAPAVKRTPIVADDEQGFLEPVLFEKYVPPSQKEKPSGTKRT